MYYNALTEKFSGFFEFENNGDVVVEMPSNIALIKYMGKIDPDKNLATNGSYSLTLPHLKTRLRCSLSHSAQDSWSQLKEDGIVPLELSEKGRGRFINFWLFLKQKFGIKGHYELKSGNNFPSDCGIASSSSSFSAITVAAYLIAVRQNSSSVQSLNLVDLAHVSRHGSGSSCRSFFKKGAYWKGQDLKSIQLSAFDGAYHLVALVETGKKRVSSSDAHKRVTSSLLFSGRTERAEVRLGQLLGQNLTWEEIYQLCWTEFWDMHALFETSNPHFGYMTCRSLEVLSLARNFWTTYQDGPVVTMDAGANVHFIFQSRQTSLLSNLQDQLKQRDISFVVGEL